MTPVRVDELARVERGLAARAAEVRAGRAALRRACRAAGVDEPRSLWVASAAGGRFRPAVAVREYLPERQREVVVDLSQTGPAHELEAVVRPLLTGAITGEGCGDLPVGGFAPYRRSPIWGLNRAFWEHADRYMAASGGDYRDAVGGSPDLIRPLVRERAERFCASLRRVRDGWQSGARPELAYLSIGASGAEGPCLFAQELTRAAAAEPVGLEGVCYLVADLSPHVLTAVRAALGDRHGPLRVGYLQLDLRTPEPTLSTWQGRILHAHVGNLFDNLPADHVEWRAGRCYLVEGLLYLPASAAHGLAAWYGIGFGPCARRWKDLSPPCRSACWLARGHLGCIGCGRTSTTRSASASGWYRLLRNTRPRACSRMPTTAGWRCPTTRSTVDSRCWDCCTSRGYCKSSTS